VLAPGAFRKKTAAGVRPAGRRLRLAVGCSIRKYLLIAGLAAATYNCFASLN